MNKKVTYVISAIIVFILPVAARTYYESYAALNLAREYAKNEKYSEAIDNYREAVSWKSPLNRWASQAEAELSELALKGFLKDDLKEKALRELRRGLRSARSWLEPHDDSEQLALDIKNELEKITNNSSRAIEEVYKPKVSYAFQALSQIGFISWMVAVIGTVWFSFSPSGDVNIFRLVSGGILSVLCYGLWLFALRFA